MRKLHVLLVWLCLGHAPAQVIVNGSFEMGVDPGNFYLNLRPGSTAITGWTVVLGSVDYVGGYWMSSHGARSLDLDGFGDAGGVQQTFSTLPRQAYRVTFDLAGNSEGGPTIKRLQVSAADQSADFSFDISGRSRSAMGWEARSWVFVASSTSTTLLFRSLTGSGWGPALDNVTVTASGPPQTAGRVVLAEDFEDGALDTRMSVRTTGTFGAGPGIKNVTNFGSTKAFGFGLSTCGASCFFSFVNTLQITFPAPEFVASISFKEMELFSNWGSGGGVFIDGQPLTAECALPACGTYNDFGRFPHDDRRPDTTFRSRSFPINRAVMTIELRVSNISNLSEIYIDDLVVQGLPAGPPEFTADSIVGAAGLQPGLSLTPGQIVTIFGTEFADPCTLGASGSGACALAQSFPLPIQLGSTQVTFNGIAAPLLVVTEQQINLIVPWELTGDTAVVVVQRGQTSSLGVRVGLSRQAIGLFSVLSSGAGAGAVLHADGRVVSRSAPIVPGEVLVIYGTGMGAVAPAVATRSPAPVEPLSRTTIPMRVFFDGTEGRILFSGLTPGFSGLCQLNVEVPAFLARNYPIVRVQNDTYISNDVSAGGPSLLDVTPNQVRLGLNLTVAVRGLNFPPNARLRVFGTDLAGVRDIAGGLERFMVSVPASLLRPGRVPISLVDASQPSEAPSNAVSLLVVP